MTNDSTESQQTPTAPTKDNEEGEGKPPSPPTVPKASPEKKSDAARYAALRNHRIRLEDAIDPDAERVSRIHKTDILFGRGKGFQVRVHVEQTFPSRCKLFLLRFKLANRIRLYCRNLEPSWQSTNERDCRKVQDQVPHTPTH